MGAPAREQEQAQAAAPRTPAAAQVAAVSPEHGFTAASVLALQRTAGNTAVTGLLDGANQGERPAWMDELSGAAGGLLGGPLGAVVGAASAAAGAAGTAAGALAGGADQRAPAPPGHGADREAERGGGAAAPAGSGMAPSGPAPAPEREAGEAAASAGAAAGAPAAAAGAGADGGAAGGPSARDPHADPRFSAMKQRAAGAAGAEKAHQPASAAAAAAQGAAAPPANDVASQAAGAQVETMAQQQPGAFNRAAFIAAVRKAVDAAAPKNLEEADDFKESGKAGKVKDQVSGLVKGGKEQSQAAIKGATEAAPDRSKATPKPVTPLAPQQPGPPPPGIAPGDAMPTARPADETDLSAGPKRVDAELAEAGVTDEQLQKSNEPDFTGALKARDEAKAHSETAPDDYRRQEEQVLGKSQEEAAGVAATGMAGMRSSKVAALAKAMGHQGAAKSADETKRAKVAADIEAIYAKTKTDVTKILADLDGKVETAFTQGEDTARKQFETYVGEKMDAYKDDRYSGWTGRLKWAKDKLFGMPSAVNAFYEQGKAGYLKAMDVVIGNVADIVGAELTAARNRIAKGRADVQAYVKQLPQDLKQVGKDAEGKLDSQFDQLSSDVDNKQSEMVDALAQKYVAAQTALDERIEELKAANKGLVDKAIDAVVGVVKTILKLKDMLLNVLSKAASVIGDIIADPIGFLGNLVDGVKSGVLKFKDNIAKHLEKGLLDWLFGAIGNAGIKLPEKLDLAGILDLAMQVLGLTYENIRARVAKLVGEENVARMEQTVDVFKALVTKGVAGLWEFVKDKLGNLEDMVLGAIKDFVIERVIKGGITWIVSLLNPAAAFIKACKAIYDIVMWIVERGAQVMEFVNSILDSIGAIAKGSLGAVASKVEDSLAKALPVAISFLASLLGLGGISEKIKGIIDTVRAPINKAVDWVVGGAVKTFKKMFGGAIGWAKGKYEKGKAFVKDKATALKDRFTGKGKPKAGEAGEEDTRPDPRGKAEQLLSQRLGAEPDRDKIDAEVQKVRAELAPEGLTSLRVSKPREDGSMSIYAAASPELEIITLEDAEARLAGATAFGGADATVTLHARVLLHEMDPDAALRNRPKFDASGSADLTEPEQFVHVKGGPSMRHAEHARGGVRMEEPMAGTDQIVLLSYNTGGMVKGSNRSHAEHQFMGAFDRIDVARVRRVELVMSHSPCSLCAPELADFGKKLRKQNENLTLKLRWLECYQDRWNQGEANRTTSPADVAALNAWEPEGPMPARTGDRKKDDAVMDEKTRRWVPREVKAVPPIRRRKAPAGD